MSDPAPEIDSPMPLGVMIDLLAQIRDERRELKEQDKALVAQAESLQDEVIKRMDEEGTPKFSGLGATASITEQEIWNISDFDAFSEFIIANDAVYLLQRRPAQSAITELQKEGTEVPGLNKFTKRGLNLRKTKQ